MSHFKSSLSTVAAVAAVLGMVACGGESHQQSANAPIGYSQPAPSEATATGTEQSGQYGSAMGQPSGASTSPSTSSGASGQLNGQYGQGQMGQTNEQTGQTGQGQMGQGQMGQTGQTGQTGETGPQYGTTPGGAAVGGSTAGAPSTMGGSTGGSMDVSSLNDAQLAAVLNAINQDEIQDAQLAEQKATSPEIKRFARDMLNAHRNIMNEDQTVLSQAQITPSDNAVSQQLRTDGQTEMSTLESMHGHDFDREYVDAQIKDHNKALELIDRIIPNIKNPQLKAQLQNVRPRLEAHLREAERVQQKLQQGSTNKQAPNNQNENVNQNQNPKQNANPKQDENQNQKQQGGSQNPY